MGYEEQQKSCAGASLEGWHGVGRDNEESQHFGCFKKSKLQTKHLLIPSSKTLFDLVQAKRESKGIFVLFVVQKPEKIDSLCTRKMTVDDQTESTGDNETTFCLLISLSRTVYFLLHNTFVDKMVS